MTGTADEGFGAHPSVRSREPWWPPRSAPAGSSRPPPEAFGGLVQNWNDAFLQLLEATPGAPAQAPGPRRLTPVTRPG